MCDHVRSISISPLEFFFLCRYRDRVQICCVLVWFSFFFFLIPPFSFGFLLLSH